MFNCSRRVFLERVLETVGMVLLATRTSLQAQQPRPGELATSGIDHPELASFDDLMTTFVKEQQIPGAALAVTKDSRSTLIPRAGMPTQTSAIAYSDGLSNAPRA